MRLMWKKPAETQFRHVRLFFIKRVDSRSYRLARMRTNKKESHFFFVAIFFTVTNDRCWFDFGHVVAILLSDLNIYVEFTVRTYIFFKKIQSVGCLSGEGWRIWVKRYKPARDATLTFLEFELLRWWLSIYLPPLIDSFSIRKEIIWWSFFNIHIYCFNFNQFSKMKF